MGNRGPSHLGIASLLLVLWACGGKISLLDPSTDDNEVAASAAGGNAATAGAIGNPTDRVARGGATSTASSSPGKSTHGAAIQGEREHSGATTSRVPNADGPPAMAALAGGSGMGIATGGVRAAAAAAVGDGVNAAGAPGPSASVGGGAGTSGSAGTSGGGNAGGDTGANAGAPQDGPAGDPPEPDEAGATSVHDPALLAGLAFDIQMDPDPKEAFYCVASCEPATLLIESADHTTLQVIWGATGSAQRRKLHWNGHAWQLEEPLVMARRHAASYYSKDDHSDLGPAQFSFNDEDGDGTLELYASAAVTYYGESISGTVVLQSEIELQGEPDERLARALLPSAPIALVKPFAFVIDKPLVPDATAILLSSDNAPVELVPSLQEGFVVGFAAPQTLPFDAEYLVELAGEDFAGVGSVAPGSIVTEPGFGVLTDGSLESWATEGISGARLVQISDPASGERDTVLYGSPAIPVVIRLAADPTATELHFNARIVDECPSAATWELSLTLNVRVVGQAPDAIEPLEITSSENLSELYIGSVAARADTNATDVVIPLGSAGSGDVLLSFQGDSGHPFVCVQNGALIDDLHLE